MRITQVDLRPRDTDEICELSFRDPRRANPFNVKAIMGLDAEELVPRFYKRGASGSRFYEFGMPPRDLVFRIELNPRYSENETHSDLRDYLYRIISSSRVGLIDILFRNGPAIVATISGFVTKFEASMHTTTPEVQLTINCEDPLLRSPDLVTLDVSGMDPSLIQVEDTLSTAPHGFQFEIEVLGTVSSFGMNEPDPADWALLSYPSAGFLAGDIISGSSEQNNKYFRRIRAGVTTQFAHTLYPGSNWPILFPGVNQFRLSNPELFNWKTISHYPVYWGV